MFLIHFFYIFAKRKTRKADKNMKKSTLFIVLLSFGIFTAKAQQPEIPNGSFENWSTATWGDSLTSWTTHLTYFLDFSLAQKSTNYHDGQYALVATSQAVTLGTTFNIPGIATLGKIIPDLANSTATASGGVAFIGKPTTMKGWYQYDQQGSDSAIIYIILTKWNALNSTRDTVGDGRFIHNVSESAYTQFALDLTYKNPSLTPDTLNIILLSSGAVATANSKLLVDNLTLDYPQSVATNDKADFYIYPNPSNGIVNVSFASNDKYSATLFNTLGQKIYTRNINSMSSTLDFTNLPKGIYMLELKSDNFRTVKKITLK
jgi:hypothetical protein